MLYNIFLSNTNKERTATKLLHYFPIYERHFGKFVNTPVVFWELGVFKGGSLQMWKKYLGPLALIIGIDIDPECKKYEDEQVKIYIGDQTDEAFLQSIIDEHGIPNVVLDDASHIMTHTCATFQFLYNKVSENGIYMVEDMHTSYWENYGGGLKKDGTFIELSKTLIDFLNSEYSGLPTFFSDMTFSMTFYDSVVVFEKMKRRGQAKIVVS